MPANATLSSSSYVNANAACGTPILAGHTGPMWEVDRMIVRNGPQPSEAHILIPLAELNQIAPRIAGVTGGPIDDILIGQQCVIKATSPLTALDQIDDAGTTIMVGRVAEIMQDLRPDMARLLILDDRWVLEAMPIIGSYWMSGSNSENLVKYRQGVAWHINERGQPNKIWRTVSGIAVPVMCYPRYGLAENEDPPSATDVSQTEKATFWTAQDILTAIQFYMCQDAFNLVKAEFPWYPAADPTTLVWDSDYASIVVDESTNEFRKAREAIYSGMNVLDAVHEVLRSCGNYALSMQTQRQGNADKNVVTVVPSRYTGDGGIALPRPCGSNADIVFVDGIKVIEGQIKEGGRNLYTKFAAGGARAAVQTRVQINDEATAATPYDTAAKMGTLMMQLTYGWDDDAKRPEMLRYIVDLMNLTTPVLDPMTGDPVSCDPAPSHTSENTDAPPSSNPDTDSTPDTFFVI